MKINDKIVTGTLKGPCVAGEALASRPPSWTRLSVLFPLELPGLPT